MEHIDPFTYVHLHRFKITTLPSLLLCVLFFLFRINAFDWRNIYTIATSKKCVCMCLHLLIHMKSEIKATKEQQKNKIHQIIVINIETSILVIFDHVPLLLLHIICIFPYYIDSFSLFVLLLDYHWMQA